MDKYVLPPISDEQRKIVSKIDSSNIVVDSVAGSGKTTTILYYSRVVKMCYPNARILLLTYNKRLRKDTIKRAMDLNLSNLDIHTYHSFANQVYGDCPNDVKLYDLIQPNVPPKFAIDYEFIVIDEAQDHTTLFYGLLSKIMTQNNTKTTRFMIIGDKFQSIYQYNGADPRFITNAPTIFQFPGYKVYPWVQENLSISYRVNLETARFINDAALGDSRIQSINRANKPEYHFINLFSGESLALTIRMIKKYGCENIFILAPSIRSVQSPVIRLANKLTAKNYQIYVPGDNEIVDQDIIKGKLVISSFHQVKGLERKCAIVFGCDESYFTFFARGMKTNQCPNTLYVAWTRASEQLVIIHDQQKNYLPFLKIDKLADLTTMFGVPAKRVRPTPPIMKDTSVTELIRHLGSKTMIAAYSYIERQLTQTPPLSTVPFDTRITTSHGTYEDVSDIIGVAVPLYYEYLTTGKIKIYDIYKTANKIKFDLVEHKNPQICEQLLYLANLHIAETNKYTHKLVQIEHYTWLPFPQFIQCVNNLHKRITEQSGQNPRFNFEVQSPQRSISDITLYGVVDLMTCDTSGRWTVWEIKCTNNLTQEHIIQHALYAYLWNNPDYKYKLINAKDGMVINIEYQPEFAKIADLLIHAKINKEDLKNEEEFYQEIENIKKGIILYKTYHIDVDDHKIENPDMLF
jgi:hypothetical protein